MASGRPPPTKRPRTEAPAVGQATSHLQSLSNRQNHWTQTAGIAAHTQHEAPPVASAPLVAVGPTVNDHERESANAAPTTQTQRSPVVVDLESDSDEVGHQGATAILSRYKQGRDDPTQLQERTDSRLQSRMPSTRAGTDLVQYATLDGTMAARQPQSASAALTHSGMGTKTFDTAATPGLPSPAPSEETYNSPPVANDHLTALTNRASTALRPMTDINSVAGAVPLSSPIQHLFGTPVVGPSPAVQRPQPAAPASHAHLQAGSTSRQRTIPCPPPGMPPYQHTALANSPTLQHRQGQQHQRRTTQGNVQPSQHGGPILQSSAPPLQSAPAIFSPNGQLQQSHWAPPPPPQLQPQPQPQIWRASRISTETLLARLQQKQFELGASLSATDFGRLALLRDAVRKEDWFYQVLSQLFCIHSLYPRQLPQSIRELQNASWKYLEILLCPNSGTNSDLLTFMSEFPEPIMDVYSDVHNAREVYEQRATAVKLFLLQLPLQWDHITQKCRQLQAPPLVQDMAELLHLKSIVLQTTCFRSIARMIWGSEESAGMEALESIHRLDQVHFCQHFWYRNNAQKAHAYAYLRDLHEAWTKHLQNGNQPSSFNTPLAITQYFTEPPGTVQPARQQQPAVMGPQQPLSPAISRQPGRAQYSATPHEQVLQQRFLQAQAAAHRQPVQQVSSPEQSVQQFQAPMASAPQSSHSHQQAIQWQVATSKPIFPMLNETPRPQPTDPVPSRSAVHQAYLRDPALEPAKAGESLLYQAITAYALPPLQISNKTPLQIASFVVSGEVLKSVAKSQIPERPGQRRFRGLNESSITYRLRCCAVPPQGFTSEGSWITADNVWPDELAFEINGVELHTRRKLHHGRYLPIDLTDHIIAGQNKIKILQNRNAKDKRKVAFAIGVEAIGVFSHGSIKAKLQRISATQSLAAIKKSLSGAVADEDDFAITSSNKTIKVVDIYSMNRLVDLPVRGSNCLHQDTFDLETFLSQCKREQPGWPTVVDCWKCPLCQGDVRPTKLVLDEFLLGVCNELRRRKLLHIKAITVEQDGTWKPKEEERTGVRSPSMEREEAMTNVNSQPPKIVEVIELD